MHERLGKTSQDDGVDWPMPGSQGVISTSAEALQALPAPVANCSTIRIRSFTPKQVALHADHSLQRLSAQSLGGTQGAISVCWNSSSSPSAGMPQLLGTVAGRRFLDL
jgi:hypothetical protein